MEMLFPPSFFTIMVHLVVHLVDEAKLGGPVHYRWMYPVERLLGKFKGYVRNRAQPEGSIAEGYLAEECLTFCSRYLNNIETRFNRVGRVNDEPNDATQSLALFTIFPQLGKGISSATFFQLTPLEKLQAHRCVLVNSRLVDPFIDEFRRETRRRLRSRGNRSISELERIVHRQFCEWFYNRIMNAFDESHSEDVQLLSRGPFQQARRWNAFNINGYRFRTVTREQGLKTQNSGVFVSAGTTSFASSSDNNPSRGAVSYYGKLVDIIELNYSGRFFVTLFKCKWAETTTDRGMKKDYFKFTNINFSHLIHTGDSVDDEPYILASNAQMVYYVEDEVDKNWSVAIHLKPRDLYEMEGLKDGVDDDFYESEPYEAQDLGVFFLNDTSNIPLVRENVDVE